MDTFKFKGYCATHGIKQAEIGELLGLGKSAVSQKMNGHKDFTLAQVRKICEKYGISADEYFM